MQNVQLARTSGPEPQIDPGWPPPCTPGGWKERMNATLESLEPASSQHPAAASSRPLILFVEDSPLTQRVVVDGLEGEFHVISAFDGEEGFARVVESRPDLILTDLIMPRLGGEEMIEKVRTDAELRDIPIVVLTSVDSRAEAVRLLESGVNDIIHKPFLMPEVIARVRNLIAATRVRRALGEMAGRKDADLARMADEAAESHRKLKRAIEEARIARELAENASRVKSNFLRMVSHELKTPITAMQLHLSVLERNLASARSRDLHEGFNRLSRSTRKMVDMVDTLLEWARVESGRCHLCVESFDVAEVIDEVIAELTSQATQKGISLEAREAQPALPPLASDRRLLRLVLVNVIGRAVQLTQQGAVTVTLDGDGSRQEIAVQDSSPTLKGHERDEIFEPLKSSVDLRWRGGSGSGLGLHVVRDIAEAMDGELDLAPTDIGNVIRLTLPNLPLGRTAAGEFHMVLDEPDLRAERP